MLLEIVFIQSIYVFFIEGGFKVREKNMWKIGRRGRGLGGRNARKMFESKRNRFFFTHYPNV